MAAKDVDERRDPAVTAIASDAAERRVAERGYTRVDDLSDTGGPLGRTAGGVVPLDQIDSPEVRARHPDVLGKHLGAATRRGSKPSPVDPLDADALRVAHDTIVGADYEAAFAHRRAIEDAADEEAEKREKDARSRDGLVIGIHNDRAERGIAQPLLP